MDTTKKSWLIANFELFTTIILAVIIMPLYAIFIGIWDLEHLIFPAVFIVLPISLAATPPSLLEGIISYLAIIGGLVYGLFWGLPQDFANYQWIVYVALFVFIGASVIGYFLSRYAYKNFDDVVSLRTLYANSSVSLFEERWKYTVDRFCNITFCIVEAIVAIIAIIIIISI